MTYILVDEKHEWIQASDRRKSDSGTWCGNTMDPTFIQRQTKQEGSGTRSSQPASSETLSLIHGERNYINATVNG